MTDKYHWRGEALAIVTTMVIALLATTTAFAQNNEAATITIALVAEPRTSVDFKYYGTLGQFRLDDTAVDDADVVGSSATFDVAAGLVRVRQLQYSRWQLDAIECSSTINPVSVNLDRGLLVFDVESGENVLCSFQNSRITTVGLVSARGGNDVDADGRLESGEPWLANRLVQLRSDNGFVVGEKSTDGSGRVLFTAPTGVYSVCEISPPGWTTTKPVPEPGELSCIDISSVDGTTTYVRFFTTETDASGEIANGPSTNPAISADGNWIAFQSRASNLVPDDNNGATDIFLHNTLTGTTSRVSRAIQGETNGNSFSPSISADGSRIVFSSYASNLVDGDTNDTTDIFLFDVAADSIFRVNVSNDGAQSRFSAWAATISADGSTVAYHTRATDIAPDNDEFLLDVMVYDVASATTTLISNADPRPSQSLWPALSADGNRIAYQLDIGYQFDNERTRKSVILLHDMANGSTMQIDAEPGQRYSERPSISADGTRIAFHSSSSVLVPDDTNSTEDVFVYNTTTGTTVRASLDANSQQVSRRALDAKISADGRRVTFSSGAPDLVANDLNGFQDIFLRDLDAGTTTRVSVGTGGTELDGSSSVAAPSASGSRIAFATSVRTTELPIGVTQEIFVHDVMTNTTRIVSSPMR